MANEEGVNSYYINTATDVEAAFNIGIHAESVAITPNGAKAYFGGQDFEGLQVASIPANTLGALLPLPASAHQVAIAPNGLKAYTTNEDDGSITVVNTMTDTIITQINGFNEPARIAFSPDGSIMYVTDTGDPVDGDPRTLHSNAVVEIDTSTYAVAGPDLQMGDDPEGIAFRPGTVFFANPNLFLYFFY